MKIKISILLIFICLNSCEKTERKFKFHYLERANTELSDSSITYLQYYFGNFNFNKTKELLKANKVEYIKPLKIDSTCWLSHLVLISSVPKYIKRKTKTINDSVKVTIVDSSLYQNKTFSSVLYSATNYYRFKDSLLNIQIENSKNIRKAVTFNNSKFIFVYNNILDLEFGSNNMTNKKIKNIYGYLSLKDNFNNVLYKTKFYLKGTRCCMVYGINEFEERLNDKSYTLNIVKINISDFIANRLRGVGLSELSIFVDLTKINYEDGTYLASDEIY